MSPLINRLKLQTIIPLKKIMDFYEEVLGFSAEILGNQLHVQAGESEILFEQFEKKFKKPFYHFAFDIPENKIMEARTWLQARVKLLQPSKENFEIFHDPDFPIEVIYFKQWNAHSIYFYDPAGNLLEFIARHDMPNSSRKKFSAANLLYVSEIGFVVSNVLSMTKNIGENFGLEKYKFSSDQFAALGDEYGLLLMIEEDRLCVPDSKKRAQVFPTSVEINASKATQYNFTKYPYEIISI